MEISKMQTRLGDAVVREDQERIQEIADQKRFRELELQQQEALVTAVRAPEQAAGRIVNEAV